MLKGKKVFLRRVEREDALNLLLWENNPSNWRVSSTEIPFSLDEINAYIDNAQNYKATGQLRFIIVDSFSNTAVGTVDLFEMNFIHKRAGVGILINEDKNRGKGYAKESLTLIEEYVKNIFQFKQLYCNIQSDNLTSIVLFEKLNYIKTGEKKAWYSFNEEILDELFFQKIF